MADFDRSVFLACRRCGQLYPLAPIPEHWPEEVRDEVRSEHAAFVAAHRDHRLTELHRVDAETYADRPLWDPLAALSFELTDGMQIYVATSSRASIDEPRRYTFIPGTFVVRNSVAIDDGDLRRSLDRAVVPALRRKKIDEFISVVREAVTHIDPEELEIAFDDAADPEVSIAPLPEHAFEEVVARSAEIFDSAEWPHVRDFLRENRAEDGALAVRLRREVRLCEPAPLALASSA